MSHSTLDVGASATPGGAGSAIAPAARGVTASEGRGVTASEGRGVAARAALAIIGFYRTAISPIRPPACRYTPSCSGYAVESIERFGAGRGLWLALRRLLRCHPFHAGGHDPVPSHVGRHSGHPAGDRCEPKPRSS